MKRGRRYMKMEARTTARGIPSKAACLIKKQCGSLSYILSKSQTTAACALPLPTAASVRTAALQTWSTGPFPF